MVLCKKGKKGGRIRQNNSKEKIMKKNNPHPNPNPYEG